MADAAAAALAGGDEASAEVAIAAQVLAMDLSIDCSEDQVGDPMLVEQAAANLQKLATDASEADKENNDGERRGQAARSGVLRSALEHDQPQQCAFGVDTQVLSGSNGSIADGAANTAGQLEAASVKSRTAELFPAGAVVPAVKPRLPAVVPAPTKRLRLRAR